MHLVTDAENNDAGYFTDGPPGTVVNANFLNTVLKEIKAVIEAAGIGLSSAESDTNTQLLSALTTHFYPSNYDRVVKTQTEFNALFTRTGANAYVITNGIRSVYIRNTGVAYACYGPTSFLSGGDTYAVIKTNDCINLICDPGTYFYFEDTLGRVDCNREGAHITNLWVKGLGTTPVAVSESILVSASGIRLTSCRVTDRRITGAGRAGFRSTNSLTNDIQTFDSCSVERITADGDFSGFLSCSNLENCKVITLTGGDGATLSGYRSCSRLSGCLAYAFVATGTCILTGMYGTTYVSNSTLLSLVSTGSGAVTGFDTCSKISACACSCTCDNGSATGCSGGNSVSSCVSNVASTGTGNARGFNSTTSISSCESYSSTLLSDAYCYLSCSFVSACYAAAIALGGGNKAYGFSSCDQIAACFALATGTVQEAFHSCTHGSALHTTCATNTLNNYIDSAAATLGAGAGNYSTEQFFT